MANWRTEENINANGGTELMMDALYRNVDNDLLDKFQIIPSRVRELDPTKVRVLWCHDLAGDPESNHLANGGWSRFHKIVFVSHWQQQQYINHYQIPWDRTIVMHNAIDPIVREQTDKKDTIDIVYHTTPHRGLEIVVPVFAKLYEKHKDIKLHVFSSFKIYGWEQRDQPYQPLFDDISKHPAMVYHGTVSNPEIKRQLATMDIFAYPSIWQETSCISLIEAMSARLMCVHPNFGALYETAANWTQMYNWSDDVNRHANMFAAVLDNAIDAVRSNHPSLAIKLDNQKSYCDLFYNWQIRKLQWTELLNSLKDSPTEIEQPSGGFFTYKTL